LTDLDPAKVGVAGELAVAWPQCCNGIDLIVFAEKVDGSTDIAAPGYNRFGQQAMQFARFYGELLAAGGAEPECRKRLVALEMPGRFQHFRDIAC
jgi:hypothetical protein